MDFKLVREKMNSDEGMELLSELNSLRLDVEDLKQTLDFLSLRYVVKSLEYKQFLGYSLTDKELEDLKQARNDLDN